MAKSFKKVIACMLAVLMGAFAVPFTASASVPANYNPDLDIVFGTYYDVGNGSGSLETGATGKLADNVGTASGDFDANYAALYDVPVTATRTVDSTTGALKVSKLEITAAAAANYNADCETSYSPYVYQTGDFFTATFVINNISQIKATQFQIHYSDNISPAGVYQYKSGKTNKMAVGSYSEGHSLTNFTWKVDGLSRLAGNSASGIYTAGTYTADNGPGNDGCYIDCENGYVFGFMNASSTFAELNPTAAPGDPNDDDYVDFIAPDGSYGYSYPGIIVCTFAFKITGEVSAANPIVFSPEDPTDSKGAFQGGYVCADAAYTFNMATYADAHDDAQPGAPKQFTFFGVNANDGGGETPHEHSYTWEVTTPAVPATCENAGTTAVETGTCSCGDTQTRGGETVPALGHNYGEWSVVTEATCTDDGEKAKTCSRCGDVQTETIPATGHNYGSVVTPPTCTVDGYTTYTCANCGDTYTADTVPAPGHTWDNGVETTPATEESTGVMTYTCTVCGATREETIPALPHEHIAGAAAEEDRVEATCTVDGSYNLVVRCTKCGEILSSTPQVIPATGHNYGEWDITPATCTVDGVKTKTCANCGDVVTEPIPATGHDPLAPANENVVEATCTTAGSYDEVVRCSVCNEIISSNHVDVPALDHDWSAWTVTKAATKTAKGEQKRTCSRCNEVETQEIESLDINVTAKGDVGGTVTFGADVVDNELTKQFKFGNSYSVTAEAATGYKFDGWKIANKVVSTAKTYSAKAYADITIEPVFSKADAAEFEVIFYDLYKNVVKKQTVTSAAEIEAPTADEMARQGFIFNGWNKNLEAITGATEVTGVYEPDKATGFTVTISGSSEATINGEAATEKSGIPYDSKVTVADVNAKGWKIGETVVAVGNSYTFYVGSNVTVTAVFDDVEAVPAITIVNVKPVTGSDFKYQFIATRVVPSGYKLEKVGFVYGKNLTDAEVTLDKVGQQGERDNSGKIKAGYNNITDANETSLSYGLTNKDGDIKVKAFMIVSKNGKQEVIYSGLYGYNYLTHTNIDPLDDQD